MYVVDHVRSSEIWIPRKLRLDTLSSLFLLMLRCRLFSKFVNSLEINVILQNCFMCSIAVHNSQNDPQKFSKHKQWKMEIYYRYILYM